MTSHPESILQGDPLSAAAEQVHFVPKDFFQRITPASLFPKDQPLEVDLGCGEGAFLTAMAARHPERNFLGVERLVGRVRNVCRIAAHQRLTNVRVIRVENSYLVEHLLPPGSVNTAWVLFPDPWPKRYHHRRRLVQEPFLRQVFQMLAPGGELCVKTDDQPYFLWMENAFSQVPEFQRVEWLPDPNEAITNFERRFLNQGLPIYRARLRKP